MTMSISTRLASALRWSLLALSAVGLLSSCSEAGPSGSPPASAIGPDRAFARGRIDIEGGLIRLAGSKDGLIRVVQVEEGDQVQAGQVLAVIDDLQARLALAIDLAALGEARATVRQLQIRLAAAVREAERLRPLAVAEAAPRREADQAVELAEQIEAELSVAQAAVVTAESRVKASEYQVDLHTIRAPLNGRIVKRTARPGDGVSTLNVTPLFVFAPDTPRIVRADLDERFVDRVKVGQAADIVIDGGTDTPRTLPARVLRVGEIFGLNTPTGDPGERVDLRVVECVLSIEDQTVRLGQRVLVRIVP